MKSSSGNPPYPANATAAFLFCDQLLAMLQPNVSAQRSSVNRITPESRAVFIVHGHDEVNLMRLRTLVRERFGLTPVILMEEPSSGQTIIEKFARPTMLHSALFSSLLMIRLDLRRVRRHRHARTSYLSLDGFMAALDGPGCASSPKGEHPFIQIFPESCASSLSKTSKRRSQGSRGNCARPGSSTRGNV